MRNRLYGGVRGRKMKVGGKLLHFPPTRFYCGTGGIEKCYISRTNATTYLTLYQNLHMV